MSESAHDYLLKIETVLHDIRGLAAAVQAAGVAVEHGGEEELVEQDRALQVLGLTIRALAIEGDEALHAYLKERRRERGIELPGDRSRAG